MKLSQTDKFKAINTLLSEEKSQQFPELFTYIIGSLTYMQKLSPEPEDIRPLIGMREMCVKTARDSSLSEHEVSIWEKFDGGLNLIIKTRRQAIDKNLC